MSTTTVMLVMVDAGPARWWWTGPVVGMTRRRGVGRLPARLMYAGWDRRSAVRRKGPLTKYAPGVAWWHRTAGDRSCSGGAPARHGGHDPPLADRWVIACRWACSATISAHRNPASSRAT